MYMFLVAENMINNDFEFKTWLENIQGLLEIDDNELILDNPKYKHITMKIFRELCDEHKGWSDGLKMTGNAIMQKYLFKNGLQSVTDENVHKTKKVMKLYFADFLSNYYDFINR